MQEADRRGGEHCRAVAGGRRLPRLRRFLARYTKRASHPPGRRTLRAPAVFRGRRSVALDGETVEVLKGRAARQLEEQTESEGWTDSGLVFTKQNGEALNPEDVTRYFRMAVRKVMLPKIRQSRSNRRRPPVAYSGWPVPLPKHQPSRETAAPCL